MAALTLTMVLVVVCGAALPTSLAASHRPMGALRSD
jgi:hypothetical protein